jgi:translation initiation factor IF-3
MVIAGSQSMRLFAKIDIDPVTQSRKEAEMRERKQMEMEKQKKGGQRMINVKQLCEMTGTRYYEHNDEIMLGDHREV